MSDDKKTEFTYSQFMPTQEPGSAFAPGPIPLEEKWSPAKMFKDILDKSVAAVFNPQAIKLAEGISMEPPGVSPHAQQAEAILDIQRLNSKGFRVVDINPNILTASSNGCQLDAQDVLELLGPEFVDVNTGNYEDYDGDPNAGSVPTLPYWRTVELPFQGNYLLIEYLPVRSNDITVNQMQFDYSVQDQTQRFDNSDDQTIFSAKHSSSRAILVNFQDTTTKPMLVRPGVPIRTEFSSVFISFKAMSPRIRVTVGYNSSIDSQKVEADAADLHMAPGYGLAANLQENFVPWNITQRDLNASQYVSGNAERNYVQIPSGDVFQADLISNLPYRNGLCLLAGGSITDYQVSQITPTVYANAASEAACIGLGGTWQQNNFQADGLIVGWITGVDFSAFWVSGGDAVVDMELVLEHVQYALGSQASVLRRLCTLPIMGFSKSADPGSPGVTVTQNFTHPIRYAIRPGEAVRVLIRVARAQASGMNYTSYSKYSVQGYQVGSMIAMGSKSGFGVGPFTSTVKLTEHPFPMDLTTYNNPRF